MRDSASNCTHAPVRDQIAHMRDAATTSRVAATAPLQNTERTGKPGLVPSQKAPYRQGFPSTVAQRSSTTSRSGMGPA